MGWGHVSGKCCKNTSCLASLFQQTPLSRLGLWTSLLRYEGSNLFDESHELYMFIFNCQLLENCMKCASFLSGKQAWTAQDSPFHNNRFLFIHQHHWCNNKLSHRSQSELHYTMVVVVCDWLKCWLCCMNALHSSTHEGTSHAYKVLSLQHVPQSSTSWTSCDIMHARGQNCSKIRVDEKKSMDSHEGTCRCNMSLGHINATFSCMWGCYDFVPGTCVQPL